MGLDLIYKIVCEKGMNIHIRPADAGDEAAIFISLTKGKKKIAGMFPLRILLSINSDPQSVFIENIDMMIEALEEETDDGSV